MIYEQRQQQPRTAPRESTSSPETPTWGALVDPPTTPSTSSPYGTTFSNDGTISDALGTDYTTTAPGGPRTDHTTTAPDGPISDATLTNISNGSCDTGNEQPERLDTVNQSTTPIGLNRFGIPGGTTPTYCGSSSFSDGNLHPRDTGDTPDIGTQHYSHSTNKEVPHTPSTTSQGFLRRDPLAADLTTLNGGHPYNDNRHVTFDTPDLPFGSQGLGPTAPLVGGLIRSPRPSDKERLA